MKHPTSSLEILTNPYRFAVGFCTIFPWNWSDWSDLILPRPWINHCVGAAMWGIFWVGAWTILEPIGVAIFVPSGPSARNFLVFLSVQTFSVLSCRKQFLLLISPVFVSLPGRSLDWGPWGSECLIGSIFATRHIRSGAPPAGRCLSI